MPNREFPNDQDRLSGFLRKSVNHFMGQLDIKERTSDTHEGRVQYEELVRFCLVTSLVPDILAAACAVFDYDAEVLNDKIPALVKRALISIPMDVSFIADVMSELPDQSRMRDVSVNLHGDLGNCTIAEEAIESFDAALYETLDIADPAIEGDWWLPPES